MQKPYTFTRTVSESDTPSLECQTVSMTINDSTISETSLGRQLHHDVNSTNITYANPGDIGQ